MTRLKKRPQTEASPERRRHQRFNVQNGAFAALSPQFVVIGQIVNISEGGLAFRYIASRPRSKDAVRLNILLTDGSFCLERLGFRTVWDVPTPQEFAYGFITYRHCGIQWEGLSAGQKADLTYFMSCYTTDCSDKESPQPVH